jgi:hypothetical protein
MAPPTPLLRTAAVLSACALSVACDDRRRLVQIAETVDTFEQGAAARTAVEFNQKPALVDVLFAVDNSPSMCEKQQALAQKFQAFISALQSQSLDFHIGVVATDMSNPTFQGKLVAAGSNPKVLTAATPNLVQVFGQNVTAVGLAGSARSQGLLAALAALTPPLTTGANSGFLRPEASLAIIIVSDEDDYSLNTVEPPATDDFVWFFTRSILGLKPPGDEGLVKLATIIGADANGQAANCSGSGTPTAACTFHDLDGHAGTRYAAVAAQTLGLVQPICASDFGPLLTTIASTIGGLTRRFELSRVSIDSALDPASLTVTVTPSSGPAYTLMQSGNDGWTYDAASFTLSFFGSGIPPPNSKVNIEYTVLTRAFVLTRPAIPSSITVEVTVGGVKTTIEPTGSDANQGWTYDGARNAVVFAPGALPAAGAIIDVRYRF